MHIKNHWDKYLLGAFTVYILIALYGGYRECNDSGGNYVRGLYWMECIGADED